MLYRPKKVPRNWYKYDVQFSLELLGAYIRGIEQHIDVTIDNFRKEKKIRVLDEAREETSARKVEVLRGLDDESWDLNSIFETYFPNLQRRSALISLFSFLEHELDELCELFTRAENLKVSLNDMRGTGIDRSVLFLTKIAGLQINKTTTIWREIQNIQKVRNLIVHNDANLKDRSGNPIGNDVIRYVEDSSYLSGEDDINLHSGYLSHMLETFDCQFQEIDKLIAKK